MSTSPPIGTAYLRIVGLAALIGIPAAFLAASFFTLVHDSEQWLWEDLPHRLGHTAPPWYLVIGLPIVGALIVLAARTLLPGDGGNRPLLGLSETPTPVAFAPGILIAALGTLTFGGVLGPEAPVIAIGSIAGVFISQLVRAQAKETAVLSSAGSLSAMSSLFGGPLVAAMLMLEGGVGLGAALLPVLLPGLVAAAIGYVIFVGFGSWGGLNAPGLTIPHLPAYQGTHLLDLLVAIAVGILTALLLAGVRSAATVTETLGNARLGLPLLLLSGAAAVGGLAELAGLLGANTQDVLFSGQASVPTLVATDSTKIVLILLVAKALAYVISLGCGYRGGPIFPSIFLGVAIASLAEVWFGVSPTLAVIVGAAAGMACQTRLIVAPLLFGTLLVGTVGLDTIPAAVLAVAAAWITTAAVGRSS